MISEKALELAAELKHTEFKASPIWLLQFKKRHNIQQYVLHGESGSADKVDVDVGKAELPSFLSGAKLALVWQRLQSFLKSNSVSRGLARFVDVSMEMQSEDSELDKTTVTASHQQAVVTDFIKAVTKITTLPPN